MTDYFKSLVDGYNQAKDGTVKAVIYDSMVKYASEYHPGYVCYDMDMYTALYKYAFTPEQRKYALDEMYSIIIDDSFQFHDEIIKNFKEVVCLTPFLKKNDIIEFDILCMTVLDFFRKELEWSQSQAKCGQADFIPDVPVGTANKYLKEVAGLIVGTYMSSLESYKEACKVLKK